jgi:RNA polymerase sigma-70 factor (ECF subfamily)
MVTSPDSENAVPQFLRDGRFVEELRRHMLSFARAQLRDDDLAQDVVQESLLSALKHAGSFRGQAAFRTWMFAIVKNKIVDVLRQRKRWVQPVEADGDDDDEHWLDRLFDAQGHWREAVQPRAWADPAGSFEDDRFWQAFTVCLDLLPARSGRFFMMREYLGLGAEEICTLGGLTRTNLHVILHRARLRLRECLERGWFGGHTDA